MYSNSPQLEEHMELQAMKKSAEQSHMALRGCHIIYMSLYDNFYHILCFDVITSVGSGDIQEQS